MHIVKSIDIHGFRSQAKPIRLNLNPKTNFLIGRNGTGKTTLINLVNAALALDHQSLRQSSWTRIQIRFSSFESSKVPSLEILRSSESRSSLITFRYRESSTADPIQFNFPFRDRNLIRNSSGKVIPSRARWRETKRNLDDQISGLYNLTWLSLARADDFEPDPNDPWEDRPFGSDVDRKLKQSFLRLIGYFSRLDGKVSDETQEFQKYWFLSFLTPAAEADSKSLRKIDLEHEERELRTIFQKFDMAPDIFEFRLHEYFNRLKAAREREDENIYESLEQIGFIYDAMRLHSLVDRWQELQSTQKATYKPKSDFIKLASDLLFQKTIRVNRSNQTEVINEIGDAIPMESLSSGEKQLLIFLGETLLQESKPHIFLADEPELSLHVEWQEELVPSLIKLNPNAQVFFATHSPDIVGQFQDGIIQMEDLI